MAAISDESGAGIRDESGAQIYDEAGVTGATIYFINSFTVVTVSATGYILPPIPTYQPPSSGSQDVVWVEILDNNLVSQGPIQFANLTAQLYHNAVGSWSLVTPYTDALWSLMMAGDFFVQVNWRGLFTFGGKCEQPGYSDSIPGAGGGSPGSGSFITLSGADYLGLIANRICFPSPGVAWNAQTASGQDPVTGIPLENAIKHYVNNNLGPATTAARRVNLLDIAANANQGANVTYTVKFGSGVNLNLFDVIRALIAQTGTGKTMGIKITRNATTHRLLFDVYVPRDLTGKAWFSQQLGNLTSIQFNLTDPTATDSLVQGAGTTFVQKTAAGTTQFNKVEQYSDSTGESDLNNLNTTASDAILSGAAGPTMTVTATDIPFLTYGRDYGIGDIVSVEVRPGVVYSDIVTGVQLTADPSATPNINVVPTIGNNGNSTATDQSIIGQLTTRIKNLEKQLATK